MVHSGLDAPRAPCTSFGRTLLQERKPLGDKISLNQKFYEIKGIPKAALQTLKGYSRSITSVVFSPDSKLVASGPEDNTARL